MVKIKFVHSTAIAIDTDTFLIYKILGSMDETIFVKEQGGNISISFGWEKHLISSSKSFDVIGVRFYQILTAEIVTEYKAIP